MDHWEFGFCQHVQTHIMTVFRRQLVLRSRPSGRVDTVCKIGPRMVSSCTGGGQISSFCSWMGMDGTDPNGTTSVAQCGAEMSGLPKGIDIDGAIQLVDAIPQQ